MHVYVQKSTATTFPRSDSLFDNDRWYRPRVFALLTMSALAAMVWMLLDNRFAHDLAMQTLVFLPSLFVVCMLCHGELALARPAAAHLSRFYLGVAVGGAVGGALVGIAAPLLLPATFEVEIGLVLVAGALCWRSRGRGVVWGLGAWLFLLGAAVTASYRIHGAGDNVVAMNRNFYGVLRVREYGTLANPASFQRTLAHGGILHGEQYMAPDRRRLYEDYKHYTDLEKLQERAKSLTQELEEIFAQDAAEQAAAAKEEAAAGKTKAAKE